LINKILQKQKIQNPNKPPKTKKTTKPTKSPQTTNQGGDEGGEKKQGYKFQMTCSKTPPSIPAHSNPFPGVTAPLAKAYILIFPSPLGFQQTPWQKILACCLLYKITSSA